MARTGLSLMTFVLGLGLGIILTLGMGRSSAQTTEQLVTGIGGVFFKADDPAALADWYARNLGIQSEGPGVNFYWRLADNPELQGMTVWSLFPRETDYFGDSGQEFMINYRVSDLDALLGKLGEQGIAQLGETEEYWYGKFAWIADGEGNRVELWEPVDVSPEEFARLIREQGQQ